MLDHRYFKKHYKMIAIDLRKQQELDADLNAVKQITFIRNVDRAGNTTIFSFLKKRKKPFWIFHKEIVRVL